MSASLPKAYRDGFCDFYGRDFLVSPDVLIPRPESEQIIDTVLNLCGVAFLPGVQPAPAVLLKDCHILDVGTGSGCLAITLSLELPESKVEAVDISEQALKIAQQNNQKLGGRVDFGLSDLLGEINDSYDVIVANLPYVDHNWDWLDSEALGFEPELALYAEDGGLLLIKKLLRQICDKNSAKYVVLEADPCQHDEIIDYAQKTGFKLLETRGFCLLFLL